MKKIIYLYLCTALVCLSFASVYVYIEETNTDKIFDQRPMIERQMYVKHYADDLSFNPYDSYSSKLENYVLTLCWVMGLFNLMDVFLLLGVKEFLRGKPEDHLMCNVLNSSTYKSIVRCTKLKKFCIFKFPKEICTKIKKRKSNGKSNRK